MIYIRTGMVHLLNTLTGEFTPSERTFDMIQEGVGGFLEENIEKLLNKHDRRPGEFRPTSELKQMFEDYQRKNVSLEELCYEVGKRLFDKKCELQLSEQSVFILVEASVGMREHLIGLEIQRRPGYVIENGVTEGKGVNRIYTNPLIIPPIRQKNCRLFAVNMRTLQVSTLETLVTLEGEDIYLFEEELLQAEMSHSLNWYVDDARKSFYAALKGRKLSEAEGLVSMHALETEKEVEQVNQFEEKMNQGIKKYQAIDFNQIGREIFYYDPKLEECFKKNLEGYGVPGQVMALSDAPLKLKTLKYTPKKIRLRSGIEIIVPDEVTEIDEQIKLKEVDGVIKEVE